MIIPAWFSHLDQTTKFKTVTTVHMKCPVISHLFCQPYLYKLTCSLLFQSSQEDVWYQTCSHCLKLYCSWKVLFGFVWSYFPRFKVLPCFFVFYMVSVHLTRKIVIKENPLNAPSVSAAIEPFVSLCRTWISGIAP